MTRKEISQKIVELKLKENKTQADKKLIQKLQQQLSEKS